jgi:hypothetical protein
VYRVQIILIAEADRQSLGIFELSMIPRKGELVAVPLSQKQKPDPGQKLVQIQEIIYAVYPPSQHTEKSLDATLLVSPK